MAAVSGSRAADPHSSTITERINEARFGTPAALPAPRPALSTPLEHTALTWHARSHRRPRFLMFAGVSLQIKDSRLSGAEARAFQRVRVRTPPEPALCARGQHVIVPVQS